SLTQAHVVRSTQTWGSPHLRHRLLRGIWVLVGIGLLQEHQEPHAFWTRLHSRGQGPGLHAAARKYAHDVAGPRSTESNAIRGQLRQRNGSLYLPAVTLTVECNIPARIPGPIAPAVVAYAAALIDLEAEISRIVTVEIEEQTDAIVRA